LLKISFDVTYWVCELMNRFNHDSCTNIWNKIQTLWNYKYDEINLFSLIQLCFQKRIGQIT